MHDVTEQLTAYFDVTVERVTAEDVLAGRAVHVQNRRHDPIPRRRSQPAWVLAAGFAATIVLIGGAVGIALLVQSGSTEVGVAPPPVGDAGERSSGQWRLLIAVGLGLLLAVVGLVVRAQRKIMKEQNMQTLERPEVETSPRPRSSAILIASLLVLAAGVLGWWIGSSGEGSAASDGSAVRDVPDIVNRVIQAYVDDDAEAVAAQYTDDAVFEEMELEEPVLLRGKTFTGRAAIRGHAEQGFGWADIKEMKVDDVMVLDNLIVYQWTARGISSTLPFEATGVTVYEMEDGLIARSFLYYDKEEFFNVK